MLLLLYYLQLPQQVRRRTTILNRILILPGCACLIWIIILLFATYTNGHTLFTETITHSSLMNDSLRPLTLSTGLVALFSTTFLFVCRIIQIQVILEERRQYKGCWKMMVRYYWISGSISSLCLAAGLIKLDGAFHTFTIGLGCSLQLLLNFVLFVLTFKERWILYKETDKMYAADLVIGALNSCLILVSFLIFQIYQFEECDDLEDGAPCVMSSLPNLMEWVGFTLTLCAVWIVYIAFYYDPKAYLQITKWWIKLVEK